ncbi:hypothetical protein AAVH_35343, partial [Aphelenchoides avenae]
NSFLVDAELCRNPNCGVKHVYPIDVVFSVHKKGPLQWWSSCFAPGVAGVHYRDKKDVAEDEVTVQKRHLSELDRRHAADTVFGHTREHCWAAMQKLMSEKYGTYLKPEELARAKDVLRAKKGAAADARRQKNFEVLGRVFMHLMFDRTYFQAAKANGYKASTDVGSSFPQLYPAGLTDAAKKQWAADVETLFAYALEQERTWNTLKNGKAKKKCLHRGAVIGTAPSPPRQVSTAAEESPKPPHPLRKANRELYAVNKKLTNENASMEAKLQWMNGTLSALTTKVESKLDASQAPTVLMQRLSTAVTALLQHSAKDNTAQDEAIKPEVALLTEQLKKLDLCNACLQDELAELHNQLLAARQKKKTA